MRRTRRWLVYALAGGLIVGHAYDVVTKGEHWPISSYPMYADLNGREFRMIRLVGVTPHDPPREVPMDGAYIRSTLLRAVRRPDAARRIAQVATAYAKAAGLDHPSKPGPFVAYRVYEQNWTLRADADPTRAPDHAKLLFEVRRDHFIATTMPTTSGATAPALTTTTRPTTMTVGEDYRDAPR